MNVFLFSNEVHELFNLITDSSSKLHPAIANEIAHIKSKVEEYNQTLPPESKSFRVCSTNKTILLWLLRFLRRPPVATHHPNSMLLLENLEHQNRVARRTDDIRHRDHHIVHLLQRREDARRGSSQRAEPRNQRKLSGMSLLEVGNHLRDASQNRGNGSHHGKSGEILRRIGGQKKKTNLLRAIDESEREENETENNAELVERRFFRVSLRISTLQRKGSGVHPVQKNQKEVLSQNNDVFTIG